MEVSHAGAERTAVPWAPRLRPAPRLGGRRTVFEQRDIVRFWAKVERSADAECWLWKAGCDKDGYGKFQVGPKGKQRHFRAHRIVLFLVTGQWPPVVMHSCDNPRCCNPGHLAPGTQTENRDDCVAKGRTAAGMRHGSKLHPERVPRGESHPATTLTAAQVAEIRRRYVPRRGVSELAREFGITRGVLYMIATGRSWK